MYNFKNCFGYWKFCFIFKKESGERIGKLFCFVNLYLCEIEGMDKDRNDCLFYDG